MSEYQGLKFATGGKSDCGCKDSREKYKTDSF